MDHMDALPPGTRVWRRVPGYDTDSDSESDQDEEELGDLSRVGPILDVLGERWSEAPLLRFAPVKLPKAGKEEGKGRGRSVGDRLRRRQSTTALTPSPFLAIFRNGPIATFRLEHVAAPIVRETCMSNGLVPVQDMEFCLLWSGPGLRDPAFKDLHEYQRVNRFPGGFELTRKDNMAEHLIQMSQDFGEGAFDFIPETFVLPEQAQAFLAAYNKYRGLWIVKPNNAACGRGIYIFRDLPKAGLSVTDHAVVSRYIANPLLIQGLKFDLRVYVVVTQYEPLRAYIYREGLARFASAPYSVDDEGLTDVYRHLTNYSINKKAPNFCENADVQEDNVGHKWSLSAFNAHLKCVGADYRLMWNRIMDLCVKTLFAVEPIIANRTRKTVDNPGVCFEIYGFDVLVDDCLKPWILEVNLSPSMQTESPLDWTVKSSLLCDAFNLVGVCNPDFRQVRAARTRNQIAQARAAHRKMLQERGSFTGLTAEPLPKDRSPERVRPNLGGRSSKPGKPMVADKPLVLDMLSEGQLKMLARSFQEFQRCNNFIRLYPTRTSVERYSPITVARARGLRGPSHILASALFGPPPVAPVKEKEKPRRPPQERRGGAEAVGEASPQAGESLAKDSPPRRREPPRSPTPEEPAATEREGRAEASASPPRPPPPEQRAQVPRTASPSKAKRPPKPQSTARSAADSGRPETAGTEAGGSVSSSVAAVPRRAASAQPRTKGNSSLGDPDSPKSSIGPSKRQVHSAGPKTSAGSEIEILTDKAAAAPPTRSPASSASELGFGLPLQAEDELLDSEDLGEDLGAEPRPASAAPSESNATSSSRSSPATLSPQELEAERQRACHVLEALDVRDRWRLLLMEYLLRVRRACDALNSKERAALAQCSAFARLSAFSRRISNLRAAWLTALGLSARSSDEDSDLDTGSLVSEISAECRSTVNALAQGDWKFLTSDDPESVVQRPVADGSPRTVQRRRSDRRIRAMARILEPEFTEHGRGRQALESLYFLQTADLERLLRSTKCIEAFEPLGALFRSSEAAGLAPRGEGLYSAFADLTSSHAKLPKAGRRQGSTPMLPPMPRARSQTNLHDIDVKPRLSLSYGGSSPQRAGGSPDAAAVRMSFARWPPPPPSLERGGPARGRGLLASASASGLPFGDAGDALAIASVKRQSLGSSLVGLPPAASRGWDLF